MGIFGKIQQIASGINNLGVGNDKDPLEKAQIYTKEGNLRGTRVAARRAARAAKSCPAFSMQNSPSSSESWAPGLYTTVDHFYSGVQDNWSSGWQQRCDMKEKTLTEIYSYYPKQYPIYVTDRGYLVPFNSSQMKQACDQLTACHAGRFGPAPEPEPTKGLSSYSYASIAVGGIGVVALAGVPLGIYGAYKLYQWCTTPKELEDKIGLIEKSNK